MERGEVKLLFVYYFHIEVLHELLHWDIPDSCRDLGRFFFWFFIPSEGGIRPAENVVVVSVFVMVGKKRNTLREQQKYRYIIDL